MVSVVEAKPKYINRVIVTVDNIEGIPIISTGSIKVTQDDFTGLTYAIEGNTFTEINDSVTFSSLGKASHYFFDILKGSATFNINNSSQVFLQNGDSFSGSFLPFAITPIITLEDLTTGSTARIYIGGGR